MTTKSDRFPGHRTPAVILSALLLLAIGSGAQAACDLQGADSAGVAAAREAIDTACPCDLAPTHAAYVACASGVVGDRIGQSLLSPSCRQGVLSCARRSTCGSPNAVPCFRSRGGNTRCTIEADAAACTPPRDGTVFVGDQLQSCCDAGPIAACASPATPAPATPTPAPSPTPTPTPGPCDPGAFPLCSPPPCPGGSSGLCSGCHFVCPLECCPNGCGLVCVTPTPTAP